MNSKACAGGWVDRLVSGLRLNQDGVWVSNNSTLSEGSTFPKYPDFDSPGAGIWARERWRRVRSVFARYNVESFLDVGGGDGRDLTLTAMNDGFLVVNLELDNHHAKRSALNGITTIEGNFLETQLPDGLVPVVGFFDSLSYFEDDTEALRKACSLLAPSGLVVCTVPAGKKLYGEHDREVGTLRRYDRDDVIPLLEAAGLELLHLEGLFGFLVPLASMRHQANLRKINSQSNVLVEVTFRLASAMEHFIRPAVGLSWLFVARKI